MLSLDIPPPLFLAARTQAEVVKAQVAVQRHRAGLVVDDDPEGETPPSPTSSQERARASAAAASAIGNNGSPGQGTEESRLRQPPPPPPLQERERGDADCLDGAGSGSIVDQHEEDGAVEDKDLRKTEEAEALASQLQIIAMHLVSLLFLFHFLEAR